MPIAFVSRWEVAARHSPGDETLTLFESPLPDGFVYRPDFIPLDEERDLAATIASVEFSNFEMHGVVARRRVAFFGASYDESPVRPLPDFLMALRARVAEWAGVLPDAFAMALINEYRPGATIGWHRDAPHYEMIAGVSLLSPARLKLRPYVSPAALRGGSRAAPRRTTHEIVLAPRSGYLIRGVARSGFEHSIPASDALRYSITFRTMR